MKENELSQFDLPIELAKILKEVPIVIPESRSHLLELIFGRKDCHWVEVAYEVAGKGRIVEAEIARCKNGVAVNYTDVYMRRRDPDCMVVADEQDTDKVRYHERYEGDFHPVRRLTLDWLVQ